MEIREGVLYSKDHEWILVEGNQVKIGVTDYAQEQLGDIVFVELPEEGEVLKKGEPMLVIESVKAAIDTYTPVSGTVVCINEDIMDSPETINEEPYEGGWLLTLEIEDETALEGLLSPEEYRTLTEEA